MILLKKYIKFKNKLIKKNINKNIKKTIIEDYIDCIKIKESINDIYKTYCFRTKIHLLNGKPIINYLIQVETLYLWIP